MKSTEKKVTTRSYFIFICVFLACSFVAFYYFAIRTAKEDELQKFATSVAMRAQHIESWLHTKKAFIDFLRVTVESNAGDGPIPEALLGTSVRDPDFQYVYVAFTDGGFLDRPSGTVPKAHSPTSRKWFQLAVQNTSSETEIYPFFYSDLTQGQALSIAAPVRYSNGTMRGVLRGVIPQQTFCTLASSGAGDGTGVIIFTDAKFVIAPLTLEGTPLQYQDAPGVMQVHAALFAAPQGVLEIVLDGTAHFFAYSRIKGTNWVITCFTPTSDLFRSLLPMQYMVMLLFFCTVISICYLSLRSWRLDTYKDLSKQDRLTQTGNRLAYEEAFASFKERPEFPLALLVCDLDNLKKINDSFGHEMGDRQILRAVECLQKNLRRSDAIFRIGGDEFVAILPGTSARTAELLLKRIQRYCEDINIRPTGEAPLCISVGIALANSEYELATLFFRADEAMYMYKSQNRERSASEFQKWFSSSGLMKIIKNP